MKFCIRCKQYKNKSEFYTSKRNSDGFESHCKNCNKLRCYEYKRANPEQYSRAIKNASLKRNYGITILDYEKMVVEQGGVCAICLCPESTKKGGLSVDHDHKTGKVRALLCIKCNTTLGLIREDLVIIKNLIEYIEKHKIRYNSSQINFQLESFIKLVSGEIDF